MTPDAQDGQDETREGATMESTKQDALTFIDDGVSRSWYFRGILLERTHKDAEVMVILIRRLREFTGTSEFGGSGFLACKAIWDSRTEVVCASEGL